MIKLDNSIKTPTIGGSNDNLNVVKSGRIEYSCRAVTLDSTYIGHYLLLSIPHGYAGLERSLGLAVIINRADPIIGTVGGESVDSFSNIVPWDGGGLYYHDGTNTVYYARYVYFDNTFINIQFTRVRTAGTHTTSAFSNANLNWMILNSKDQTIDYGAIGGGGDVSGKKYYIDTIIYDADMNIDSTVSTEGDYIGENWKYPFIFAGH